MGIINSVVISGRLVEQASLKTIGTGLAVVEFTIAVNERTRDNSHESGYGMRGNFFDVVGFGNYFKAIGNSLSKGREVTLSGRLRQDRWEKDGKQHSRIVIVADDIEIQREPRAKQKNSIDPTLEPQGAVPEVSAETSEIQF